MTDSSIPSGDIPGPELTMRYGADADQVADVWPGDSRAAQRPLLVMVHGGFWRPVWDRAHTRAMCTALREAGWSAVSIEYRRKPGDPDLTVGDVASALAAAPTAEVPHNGSVVVLGHSAGGHLALWAAAAAPAPGLIGTVGLAPVADLQLAHQLHLGNGAVTDFLGTTPEHRPDLDPTQLPGPATPVVIVHGAQDTAVPLAVGESYAATHPGTRLVAVPDADHFAVIDPRSVAWVSVIAAVRSFSD